jgi:hypothetical protein
LKFVGYYGNRKTFQLSRTRTIRGKGYKMGAFMRIEDKASFLLRDYQFRCSDLPIFFERAR